MPSDGVVLGCPVVSTAVESFTARVVGDAIVVSHGPPSGAVQGAVELLLRNGHQRRANRHTHTHTHTHTH